MDYTFEDIEGFYKEKYQELVGENSDNTDTSILFNEEECDDIPLGATKMGGLPDLPPDAEYPVRGEFISGGKTIPASGLPLLLPDQPENRGPY